MARGGSKKARLEDKGYERRRQVKKARRGRRLEEKAKEGGRKRRLEGEEERRVSKKRRLEGKEARRAGQAEKERQGKATLALARPCKAASSPVSALSFYL